MYSEQFILRCFRHKLQNKSTTKKKIFALIPQSTCHKRQPLKTKCFSKRIRFLFLAQCLLKNCKGSRYHCFRYKMYTMHNGNTPQLAGRWHHQSLLPPFLRSPCSQQSNAWCEYIVDGRASRCQLGEVETVLPACMAIAPLEITGSQGLFRSLGVCECTGLVGLVARQRRTCYTPRHCLRLAPASTVHLHSAVAKRLR